ncbi:ComEC/Rec2 family competence protein, partial [Vicingaceae bacterium]|nr:ComEC/Rec2 family competence protein [Vicingaceae bacterium]
MRDRNIYLITFEDEFITLKSSNSLIRYAETARASVIQIYKELQITNQNLAVLVALTLGDKSVLDSELQQQYAGAMHILAVSGLHVGIVFLIFNFLLSKLPGSLSFRIIQTITLLLVIWAFAFLAGLSPSVQLAGWMFLFVIVSKLLKRNSNVLNSIAMSAFLLLLIDPNNLFQVGFQLSYSPVIGIVLIDPVVYKLVYCPNWFVD